MRSRIAVCVLGIWSLWASTTTQAQMPGTISAPRIYAPAPYDASYTWPAWGVPAYDYPNPGHIYTQGQYGPGPDGYITERLPEDKGWDYEDTPADRFFAAALKATTFRLEYLQWVFRAPGEDLLGAPVAGETDPQNPFQTTVAGLPGRARVPTTDALHFRDVQGLRGTIEIPTSLGSLEGSFFAFDRANSEESIDVPPANVLDPADQVQLATSTRLNGQISTNLFLYNDSFRMVQTSHFLGAEANWLMRSPYEYGLVVRPLAGFRYINFRERLFQQGVFLDSSVTPPATLRSDIASEVTNEIYAPQLGLRMEWVESRFTLGFEPKVAMGVNAFDASVRTDRLRNPADPPVKTQESGKYFAPVGDFKVYARVNVRDNFSLLASYQLMLASGISRPSGNIFYNDNGPQQPAAVVVDTNFRAMVWQGISFGGEWRFR